MFACVVCLKVTGYDQENVDPAPRVVSAVHRVIEFARGIVAPLADAAGVL